MKRRLSFLMTGLLAGAAAADEARWSRPVEVPAPGPVVVELDGRAAERATLDLQVIGPDGRAIAAALRTSLPERSGAAGLPPAERGGEKRKLEAECGGGKAGEVHHLDCFVQLAATCSGFEIELAPREAPLGFRVWRAERGSWQALGSGEQRRHGTLRLEAPGGAALRFHLEAPAALELLGASCEERRSQLHFTADGAGTYQLTYGRRIAPATRLDCASCDAVPPSGVLLPLGDEKAGTAPAWPAAALPGPKLQGEFGRSWPFELAGEEGQLVYLRLPPESLTGAGRAPEGLRLDLQGEQVPYLAEVAPQPQVISNDAPPAPAASGAGRSRYALRFDASSGEAQLQLAARGPFERRLRFFQREPVPGRSGELEIAPATTWSCPASLVLPCELEVTLRLQPRPTSVGPRVAGEKSELFIEIEDGDNPPLPAMRAELWIRRPVLYFVHPGKPVVLREGIGLAAPRYDFASLGPLLLREDAVDAGRFAGAAQGGPVEGPRWLLPAAVGFAALALLAVLARVIRKDSA